MIDPGRRSAASQEAVLRSCTQIIMVRGPAAVSIDWPDDDRILDLASGPLWFRLRALGLGEVAR